MMELNADATRTVSPETANAIQEMIRHIEDLKSCGEPIVIKHQIVNLTGGVICPNCGHIMYNEPTYTHCINNTCSEYHVRYARPLIMLRRLNDQPRMD